MKVALSALTLAATLLAAPAMAGPSKAAKTNTPAKATETFKVDPAASKVEWLATKVTGKHNGTVDIQSGSLDVAGGRVAGGAVTLDMKTIKVLDLKDAEYNGKLVGHLNSDDFFSVEKNPTSAFKITSIAPVKGAAAGQPNYTVNGDLTIKGITNRITFPATVSVSGKQVTAVGTTKINRTKYDIRYGSPSFFNDLGDKAISDEFTVTFNLVANK